MALSLVRLHRFLSRRGGGGPDRLKAFDGKDYPGAQLLHRVRWSSGTLPWENGPENYDRCFSPEGLVPGVTARFRVTAPAGALDGLLIQFGTYGRRNEGWIDCVLRVDGAVRSARLDMAPIEDNAFTPVLALTGLRFRAGREYVLALTPSAAAGEAVAVYVGAPQKGMRRRLVRGATFSADAGGILPVLLRGDRPFAGLRAGAAVTVCTHGLPAGGAERQWVYLAIGLQRAGYRVRVLLFDAPAGETAHYAPMLAAAGIPVEDSGAHATAALDRLVGGEPALAGALLAGVVPDADRLLRFVLSFRRMRPAAVFAQLDDPNLYAGLGALLAGVPVVALSFRNVNPTHFPAIDRPWYRDAYRLLAQSSRVRLTGNSADGNKSYAEWIGLPPGRVGLIPNAVDAGLFAAPGEEEEVAVLRRSLGLQPGAPVVLGVFRLSAEKNPWLFLQVCVRLAAGRPGLRVLVAGTGPLAVELEARAAEIGLGGRIMFLGRRADVSGLMRCASLLLLTSDHEGMPNVVSEAQSVGLPVVATDAGGTAGAMRPGISGFLCGTGDLDGLTAACAAVLDDTARARAMGEAGAAFARKNSGIGLLARRYLAALRRSGAENAWHP